MASKTQPHDHGPEPEHAASAAGMSARVALVSHIGGHKFAGNVIVYVPPGWAAGGGELAGRGIWYGRVEPRHVEGIVKETVLGGRVIRELWRGATGLGGAGGPEPEVEDRARGWGGWLGRWTR